LNPAVFGVLFLRVFASEAQVLQQITAGLSEQFWIRYRELIAGRESGLLGEAECVELVGTSDQNEELTLQRTQALFELARRRNKSKFRAKVEKR
jgi:hypothetical protein